MHAVQHFMEDSLVHLAHWFVTFTGSLGSMVHEVHWFMQITSSGV